MHRKFCFSPFKQSLILDFLVYLRANLLPFKKQKHHVTNKLP